MASYSEKLKHPLWQKKRLEILKRDKWACKLCKDKNTTLHIHHHEYGEGEPWEIQNFMLVTLCEHCHMEVELLKKEQDFDFDNIKIHKSNNWQSGSRIMFIGDTGTGYCYMRIYGKSGNYIVGYNLSMSEIRNFASIIKFALK
jgi:glutaredoxin